MKWRTMIEVPVLIVGAGPAGLATAIELARRDVECVLIDRRTAPSPLPRANAVSTRAMELVRSWGLEARVREDAIDVEWLGWMGDTLASPTGSAVPVGFPTRDQSALISPTGPACVSQSHLETVLLEHLRSLPAARVELGTVLTGIDPGPDAVTVTLERPRVSDRGADGVGS